MRFDASSAECLVFTYKEGLLSAIAHDLKIRVTKFVIDVDEQARTVVARFDASSLRVVCAMEDGAESRGALSDQDKGQINENIVRDVIEARQFPDIRFTSSAAAEAGEIITVKGTLALHGTQRRLTIRARRQGDGYVVEVRLHQPDFGIRPYRAMLGTLKVKSDVTVRVTVPFRRSASV